MKNSLQLLIVSFILSTVIYSSETLVQSGPMVGYSDMMEVSLWIQTTDQAKVKFIYWADGQPDKRLETDEVSTNKQYAYTANLIADQVEPGNQYIYELYINGKKIKFPYPLKFQTQTLWQWRTDAPDFSFAMGSGSYINEMRYDRPGEPYGEGYEIFNSIYQKKPDFMLWLGDNIYLREPDWNTRTGILYRYTHTRSLPEMQPLLGSVHHYAIWDDHDFGPNDSNRSFWNKETTLEGFKIFFPNPSYGINGKPGTTTFFQWSDVDFFLLDNRYYRSPQNREYTNKQILGDEQIEWLIDALCFSQATFKVIVLGGQFLNPLPIYENHANYLEETSKILKMIEQESIPGILFISGDRHFTEVTKLDREKTYPLFDFTISPLISGPCTTCVDEPNYLRVGGTGVFERNFAIMTVSGKRKNRTLSCTVYNTKGEELWSYSIHETDLE